MTDYAGVLHGNVQFPLPHTGNGIGGRVSSLLRDADPALFFLLEFYSAIIEHHLGDRLRAEASAGGATKITQAVAETLPLDPDPYLQTATYKFPLLSAYRSKTAFDYEGQFKLAVDTIEVAYALPALTPGAAERLSPILHAVAAVIDNRTERGFDPAYKPSGFSQGASVWPLAGVARAEVKSVGYGAFAPTDKLYYPAVMLTVELRHRSSDVASDFLNFSGANLSVDQPEGPDGPEFEGVVVANADV